jgi:hypothetical protein
MKASLTNAVYLFAAPLSQAARTIDALRIKQEEGAAPAGGHGRRRAVRGRRRERAAHRGLTHPPSARGRVL